MIFPKGDQCVLMSVITGDAQAMVKDLEDKEVVELCMNVLRDLYKEQVSWSGAALRSFSYGRNQHQIIIEKKKIQIQKEVCYFLN